MSELSLNIVKPKHGSVYNSPAASVQLKGELKGNGTGLYFKWYVSPAKSDTKEKQPEINSDHSKTAFDKNLQFSLEGFGSYVITLAATDNEELSKVTRAALAGGAPPDAPKPCVIHCLQAEFKPKSEEQDLGKNATISLLAPAKFARKKPDSDIWERNTSYLSINGINLTLSLSKPNRSPALKTWDIDLHKCAFSRKDDKTWLHYKLDKLQQLNLSQGTYELTLIVSAAGKSVNHSINVTW